MRQLKECREGLVRNPQKYGDNRCRKPDTVVKNTKKTLNKNNSLQCPVDWHKICVPKNFQNPFDRDPNLIHQRVVANSPPLTNANELFRRLHWDPRSFVRYAIVMFKDAEIPLERHITPEELNLPVPRVQVGDRIEWEGFTEKIASPTVKGVFEATRALRKKIVKKLGDVTLLFQGLIDSKKGGIWYVNFKR